MTERKRPGSFNSPEEIRKGIIDARVDIMEAFISLGPQATAGILKTQYSNLAEYYRSKGMELEAGIFQDVAKEFESLAKDLSGLNQNRQPPRKDSPN